jgi:hypothetical protein
MVPKKINEFQKEEDNAEIDEEVVRLRYKRYLKRIDQRWEGVYEERARLVDEEKRKLIRMS